MISDLAIKRRVHKRGWQQNTFDLGIHRLHVSEQFEEHLHRLKDALRHVAVVRYDAFGDVGGRMSFSVAFLDDSNDGIVISSINGRTEGRTYIKGIKAGNSVGSELSPEEIQVIQMAQQDK